MAKNNNIDNYIVLDCRYSTLNWIKNSIIKSELPALLRFKELDIDWLKCHEFACNSLIKVACNLWNEGFDTNQIAEQFKLHSISIRNYLKQGAKLDWCNYPKKSLFHKKHLHKNHKKVICLNTNEIFDSLSNAEKQYNIMSYNISACCRGKQKSAGKHPITGDKLVWMYYDEYKKII